MSLCRDGLGKKVTSMQVSLLVDESEELLQLANALEWQHLAELALPDLQQTAKGYWWRGRKLNVRTHLGVLVLQCLLKETDRGIERRIRQTPLYQVFCGYGGIVSWKCPDHTKIETFRNRLRPATHKQLGDYVLQVAQARGFADPTWMDLDSTVQEANMAYPSDAQLLRKLARKGAKVLTFLKKAKPYEVPPELQIDLEAINRKAKDYFFLAKNTALEHRRTIFRTYHTLVKHQLKPLFAFLLTVSPQTYGALPWHVRQAINTLTSHGWRYVLDVAHFIRTHTIKPDKLLSFHCFEVACIRKGKVGKENEFGRVFQLGRIGGNFLVPFTCTDVRMDDKQSLLPAIAEHATIFGPGVLQEVGTDKGYYSATNLRQVQQAGINTDGIQRPAKVKDHPPEEIARPLRNRRAGIEPLIGHAKAVGLGKSKMKSDRTTLAAGYRAVLGFNLHQFLRHLTTKPDGKAQALAHNGCITKSLSLFFSRSPRRQAGYYFATATS